MQTMRGFAATTIVLLLATVVPPSPALAQVKPGDTVTRANAAAVQSLVSPGTWYAVSRGMEMRIVPHTRIEWPPPYRVATEKYSGQVRLSTDRRSLEGYVAGQPFPLLDPNDPDVATKIMWNSGFRPIGTDDADLRYFECQVVTINPGAAQTQLLNVLIGHLGVYAEIGRTEVEPLPVDPDFKTTGILWRAAAYPIIQPAEERGAGGLRFRYWDPMRADDAWAYLPQSRRVRRVNEVVMTSSPGLSTWDPDHSGGFAAKLQEYNFKFMGEREMLGCVNAANSPAHPCPTDGGATSCPDNWEMRHLYIVEVTPRPERITGVLQSKTVVYIDGEGWFNPYVDSYDRKGELWKTQIYLLTYRDRPVPDARVAVYPYKREFVVAAASVDTQSGNATTCYLPSSNSPERECWYINMGAVDREFFTAEAMARAGH
jgi:hypothetical protein